MSNDAVFPFLPDFSSLYVMAKGNRYRKRKRRYFSAKPLSFIAYKSISYKAGGIFSVWTLVPNWGRNKAWTCPSSSPNKLFLLRYVMDIGDHNSFKELEGPCPS
ncbi:hypothetical protein VNO77_43467 [Canavalia gladiata]|uniref:Uncharacterized protein n=1 Tax=Canavalia gladiata TaxID=3824 RepID=A0AAN9JWA6_CANGL